MALKPSHKASPPDQEPSIRDGWLVAARRSPSEHQDARPADACISAVILHNVSLPAGHFGGDYVEDLFCGRLDIRRHADFADLDGLRVAPHLLIRRDGSIIQFVPFHRRAWHAGRSSLAGRADCNDFSIGIELEGTDRFAYQPIQYRQLAGVLSTLFQTCPELTADRVVGHAEVAPGRKTDPGPAFDWRLLQQLLDET